MSDFGCRMDSAPSFPMCLCASVPLPLTTSALTSFSAARSAFSRLRSSVCCDVPSLNVAWAFLVLLIMEARARRASRISSGATRAEPIASPVISSRASRSARRLSRSIVCCHDPGASFCCAFSDLLMRETIGRRIPCRSSFDLFTVRIMVGVTDAVSPFSTTLPPRSRYVVPFSAIIRCGFD